MHSALSLAVALSLASLPLPVGKVAAQATPGPALSAVMTYRLTFLGDSTRFDACTVARQMGNVRDVAALIDAPVRRLLDGPPEPCPRAREPGRSATVLVDSIVASDSVTHVHLTVIRGENVHREDYTVVRRGNGEFRGVREVRLWGAAQAYPGRRPAAGGSGER